MLECDPSAVADGLELHVDLGRARSTNTSRWGGSQTVIGPISDSASQRVGAPYPAARIVEAQLVVPLV